MSTASQPRPIIPFPSAVRRQQIRERKAQTAGSPRSTSPVVGSNVVIPDDADEAGAQAVIKAAENAQVKAIYDKVYSGLEARDPAEAWNEERATYPDTVVWLNGRVVAVVRAGHARFVRHLWGRPD